MREQISLSNLKQSMNFISKKFGATCGVLNPSNISNPQIFLEHLNLKKKQNSKNREME